MISFLAINIVFTVFSIYMLCFNKKGIEINHTLLFGLGFLYYWMLPIVVGQFKLFQYSPAMDLWHGIYSNINPTTLTTYLKFSLIFSFFFYFGNFLGKSVFKNVKNDVSKFDFDRKLLVVLLVAITPIVIYFLLQFRDNLFSFYQNEMNVTGEKGSLISASLILLSMTFMYAHAMENKFKGISFSKAIFNRFTVFYFVIALLILTMGGRLYFFSSVIMLLVYRSVYFKTITRRATFLFFIGSVALMGVVGIIRSGDSPVSFQGILFNIASEPLYTSFSLISFLDAGRIDLLNTAVFLGSDFSNLIPSFILQNKSALLVSPQNYGYVYFAPIGAMNSFMSFMINFGMVGSVIVIFLFSFFMSYLKAKTNHRLFRVMYIMMSGWIPFTFFRDPFSVSIVKQMFQYSFFVPLMIIFVVILVSNIPALKVVKRKRMSILSGSNNI